jgi:hypothetical protein
MRVSFTGHSELIQKLKLLLGMKGTSFRLYSDSNTLPLPSHTPVNLYVHPVALTLRSSFLRSGLFLLELIRRHTTHRHPSPPIGFSVQVSSSYRDGRWPMRFWTWLDDYKLEQL